MARMLLIVGGEIDLDLGSICSSRKNGPELAEIDFAKKHLNHFFAICYHNYIIFIYISSNIIVFKYYSYFNIIDVYLIRVNNNSEIY